MLSFLKRILKAVTVTSVFLGAVLVSASPVVFWGSDPVSPNETVLLAGSGFGASPSILLLSLKHGVSGKPWKEMPLPDMKKAKPVDALQGSDESVKFVIPVKQKPGAYAVWVRSAGGDVSEPFLLNVPRVYWQQGDAGSAQATPGGWLRIFGRNIAAPGRLAEVVLCSGDTGRRKTIKVLQSDTWSAKISVPEKIELGEYDVFLHNGEGKEYGWCNAGRMKIAPVAPWPQTVFNVRDFGATGKGSIQDTLGIEQALAAAESNGGGIVYLPRGRYLMEGTLELPRFTVLRGEDRKLSAILWSDMEEPADLVAGSDHFGIEDLTLYATTYRHGIAAEIRSPEAGHTFARRVTMRAVLYRGHLKPEEVDRRFRQAQRLSTGGGDSIRFGGENVEITDCDLYGSGRAFYLYNARGGRVANNRFFNGRWGWYCLTGSDRLIYENNTLTGADLMSTGGGLNCLGSIYSQNVFYAHNRISLCHGWDREAMTTDAGHGAYYGSAVSVSGRTLVIGDDAKWRGQQRWKGGGVFIMYGKGMGQYRQIESVADDQVTVTIDRSWDVDPDETSIVSITMMQQNYLFIDNHFEDAGIAIQYYGTSINHVAAGNTCTRAGGFFNSGRWYRHYQPSWYCQFFENEILDGNCYRFGSNNATHSGPSFLGTYGLQRGDNPAPLAYCSIHRNNSLHNNAEIRLKGVSADRPGVRDVIVEHNTIANSDAGIVVDKGCVGVLTRENALIDVNEGGLSAEEAAEKAKAEKDALLAQQEPVYHQTFEKTRGRYFFDSSPNEFVGMQSKGSVELEEGLCGNAGKFDGKGFVTVGERGLLRFPKITISAWIHSDKERGRYGIVAKRARSGAAAFVLAIRDRKVTFEGTDVTGDWSYNMIAGGGTLRPGWNHVAATCEEQKQVRLFLNGREVGRKAVKNALVTNDEPLTIGYEAWGGENNAPRSPGNFIGLIDEVKVWSRILSDEEIQAEFETLDAAAAEDENRRKTQAMNAEKARQEAQARLQDAAKAGWKVIATDDFSGGKLNDCWKTLRGRWQVQDGVLSCNEVSFLALNKALSLPVRIEYDARSKTPGDLTAFWGNQKDSYKAGYFAGFASNGNTMNKLLRHGESVATAAKPLAVPGKWHHVVVQILEGRVQMAVDGAVVFDWEDAHPPKGADTAGILSWGPGDFDNLTISTLP